MNDLIMTNDASQCVPEARAPDTARVAAAYLSSLTGHTLRAYGKDMVTLARYLNLADQLLLPETATALVARHIFAMSAGQANELAMLYKAHMVDRCYAPNTIGRRLTSLRKLVDVGRVLGLISWSLEVKNPRIKNYRDTRGPAVSVVRKMLDQVTGDDALSRRNRCVLRVLWDMALRRAELVNIDLADLELDATPPRVAVVRKGSHGEKQWLHVPAPTVQAIRSWLQVRGSTAGPLVVRLDPMRSDAALERLTASSVARNIVRPLGVAAGVKNLSPHKIRHGSGTHALRASGKDIFGVQKFMGHKSPATTMFYVDNMEDEAGKMADLIAGEV